MAKARKQKPGSPSSANATEPEASDGIFVRHQKLCVAVDMEMQRIYGHTELQVVIQNAGSLNIHAGELVITEALVNGSAAKLESKKKAAGSYRSVKTVEEAAALVRSRYTASLAEESAGDYFISFAKENSGPTLEGETAPPDQALPASDVLPSDGIVGASTLPAGAADQQIIPITLTAPPNADPNPVVSSSPVAAVEDVRTLSIRFYVEKPRERWFFEGNVFHTSHGGTWFPWAGLISNKCSYHLEITVNCSYVAVTSGKLAYQVLCKEDSRLKTYVYEISVSTAAPLVKVVVSPLVILPQQSILHMCPPGLSSKMQATVNSFQILSSFYEEYLGSPVPHGCYKQVFLPPEHLMSSMSIGASLVTLSTHLLVDERVIDQAIVTYLKFAYALAKQWFGIFITPESERDDWLFEGICGNLVNHFVKKFLGTNEALFRRYKAIEAVTEADIDSAAPLSPASLQAALYRAEKFGLIGKLRQLKAVAVIQMLEKHMGADHYRKVLQRVVAKAQDPARNLRTLSTREFRHYVNKIGNVERLFLKEFFPRWVECQGCPILRMEFEYNKKKNCVELSVRRDCTAPGVQIALKSGTKSIVDVGWPGMMNIQVHELDGVHDHPNLSMSGNVVQQLDLPCHSKFANRRPPRPKKAGKVEIIDDLADDKPSIESPLLWVRPDPGMDYLAKIQLQQPEQMWINQLEKDKDIVAQLQAIAALKGFPNSFAIVSTLNACLIDTKVFCRVRIEAAFALASNAGEATNWRGLAHLIHFFRSRCFDGEIGLPKSNNFHEFSEYLVLQAVPMAISVVRGSDGFSPPEAVDFILTILKHNDNSGNAYSDSYWLAGIIESVAELDFPQESIVKLSKILKQIDRYLHYDRLMPSYNYLVTRSCISTIMRLALKFRSVLRSLDSIERLLLPYKASTSWLIRTAAFQAYLDMSMESDDLDKAIDLAIQYIRKDPCLKVQSKVMAHVLSLVLRGKSGNARHMNPLTATSLVELFKSDYCICNHRLRHQVYMVLQALAGRPASLMSKSKNDISKDTLKVRLQKPQAQEPPSLLCIKPSVDKVKSKEPKPGKPNDGPKKIKIRLPSLHPKAADEKPAEEKPAEAKPVDVQAEAKPREAAEEMMPSEAQAKAASGSHEAAGSSGNMEVDEVIPKDLIPETTGDMLASGEAAPAEPSHKHKEKHKKDRKEKKERDKEKKRDKKEKKDKEKRHKDKKHKRDKHKHDTVQPSGPQQGNELLQVKQEIADAAAATPPATFEHTPIKRLSEGTVLKLVIKRPKAE